MCAHAQLCVYIINNTNSRCEDVRMECGTKGWCIYLHIIDLTNYSHQIYMYTSLTVGQRYDGCRQRRWRGTILSFITDSGVCVCLTTTMRTATVPTKTRRACVRRQAFENKSIKSAPERFFAWATIREQIPYSGLDNECCERVTART